ncbi:MAG TPA: LrgA [Gammaproteobacteria bacterium]|nr:LrgA [Gammaproteobacteria bacterium]
MNESRPGVRIEKGASYFLLTILFLATSTRLGFDDVWKLPLLDLVLTSVALALVILAFWFGRTRRWLRLGVIAFAAATQLLPMLIRQPAVLFPVLGALIPVLVAIGLLVLLSRKEAQRRQGKV